MLRTLDHAGDLRSKRVILRCDLNVPLSDGVIQDDGRIRASVPTIKRLVEAGARVIVCSHLGRPDGEPNPKYSLAPVAERLEQLLGATGEGLPRQVGNQERPYDHRSRLHR